MLEFGIVRSPGDSLSSRLASRLRQEAHVAGLVAAALAEIRKIYFATTKRTIRHDLAHAIELLKAIPTEADREKARVYMDGLAQLRSEWGQRSEVRKAETAETLTSHFRREALLRRETDHVRDIALG